MKYETPIVERGAHGLRVTLNRPEALNAMSRPLMRELRALFGGLTEDRETRVVGLRGAGRAFCAGRRSRSSPVCRAPPAAAASPWRSAPTYDWPARRRA